MVSQMPSKGCSSIPSLISSSTWNLFISKVLNILLIKGSFSLVVLNLSFVSYFNFVMFNLTLARSRWWSYPKLAQDFQLSVSIEKWWYGQTNFGPFFAWDSNFLVDIFMRKDFLSPFAFISPHPCFPIVYSLLSLQLSTLALMSPLLSRRSLAGVASISLCSCLKKLFLNSSSASFVGE